MGWLGSADGSWCRDARLAAMLADWPLGLVRTVCLFVDGGCAYELCVGLSERKGW